jgi:hypothetical protein
MLTPLVFSLCIVAALGLFLHQLWGRFNVLRGVASVERFDRIPERIQALLVYFFGQKKFVRPEASIVREQTAGWMHFFIFWGFTILGLQIVTMFGRAYSDDFSVPLFSPGLLGGPYMLLRDVMEVAVLISIGGSSRAVRHHPSEAPSDTSRRASPAPAVTLGGVSDSLLHRMHHDGLLRQQPHRRSCPRPGMMREAAGLHLRGRSHALRRFRGGRGDSDR